jgi:hypothetical protein
MISVHFDASPVIDFKSTAAAKGIMILLKSFFMACYKLVFI